MIYHFQAPRKSELEDFLAKHPGYKPKDQADEKKSEELTEEEKELKKAKQEEGKEDVADEYESASAEVPPL